MDFILRQNLSDTSFASTPLSNKTVHMFAEAVLKDFMEQQFGLEKNTIPVSEFCVQSDNKPTCWSSVLGIIQRVVKVKQISKTG